MKLLEDKEERLAMAEKAAMTKFRIIPKKCLTLGLWLEYETFIREVFCPNLFVCVYVCLFVCVSAFFEKNK